MLDFSTGKALSAMRRTTPFIAFRMIIYCGIGLAYALGIGTGAGTGYLLTAFSDDPGSGAGIGGLAGFGIVSVALYWAREYLLYLVKAGHIAVLMQVYFKVIEGQQPDAEWDAKLRGLSDDFRDLKDKALAWTGPLPSSGKT